MTAAETVVDPKTIPPEIGRWNWGAFLLNWIWGLGNGTPIALLTLVPPISVIMPFVLGAKGSGWAWHNKRWDSIEQFKRVQRKWAIAGLIVWIVGVAAIACVAPGIIGAYEVLSIGIAQIENHPAYALGVAKLQSSSLATSVLGTPIAGRLSGEMKLHTEEKSDGEGSATFSFPVKGPKGSGMAFVEAIKKDGVWSLTKLALKPDRSDTAIDIVGSGAAKNAT